MDDDSKDEKKPLTADSAPEEAALLPKPRRSGKGGPEMPKEDEVKAAAEKKEDQPKRAEPQKEQPKGKTDTKVRSRAERLRRNIDR